MSGQTHDDGLIFPFAEPPANGAVVEVAPGLLWLRLALPFRLDHVNIYLLEEEGGWAIVDTGIDDAPTRAAWEGVLRDVLGGRAPTRIIATHYHPDHIGLAGWFCERFGLPLHMSGTEYLMSLSLHLDPGSLEAEPHRSFYLNHGLDAETTELVVTQGHRYLRMVSGLPPTFHRLVAGDDFRVGERDFSVLTGGGHAPEQVMLHGAGENLLLAADQVLARISPNISVTATVPEGNPLGLYLRSLRALKAELPEDVLVLPGHNLPFRGLHRRIDSLMQHHRERCDEIWVACRARPLSAAEVVPVIFHRALDPHQTGFAFGEVLAHLNFMVEEGRLTRERDGTGVIRFAGV